MTALSDRLCAVAAIALRNIPSRKWRKRYAKLVGPLFEGSIAKTALGFPMTVKWHDNVNRLGFEGSFGVVTDFINALPPDASYIDVGANQGFTTIMASKVLENGLVTSFEPSPTSFMLLSKNIFINNCKNIQVRNSAVAGENRSLFLNESKSGNSGGFHVGQTGTPIQAGPIYLSDVWDESRYSGIFIKIDTEGFELQALKGMVELLNSGFVKKLVVEIDSRYLGRFDTKPEDIYEYLHSFGFTSAGKVRTGHYDEVFTLRAYK